MALTQLAPPYPIFTDKSGTPLDNGYLYFGEVNKNPETNPIQVYYDSAFTQPAAQPLRTSNGYVMRNGSPAAVYADVNFSVTIRDKNSALVIYSSVGYGIDPAAAVTGSVTVQDQTGDGATTIFGMGASPNTINATNVYIDGVYQEKDTYSISGSNITFSEAPPLNAGIEIVSQESPLIGGLAAGQVSYNQGGVGAVNTTVKAKLQETVSVKDFGAVGDGVTDDSAAIQAAIDIDVGRVYFPAGTYRVTSKINYNGCGFLGAGNDKTIIQCEASGVNFEKTSAVDRSAIECLTFLGDGTNEGFGHGSNVIGWFRSVIRDCRFANFDVSARIQNAVLLRIEGCDFSDGPLIFEPVGTPDDYNNNVTLVNCFFRDVLSGSGNGYACDVNMPSEFEGNNFNFIGCACDDSYSGIRIKNARAVFNNCSWERHTNYFVVADNAQVSFNSGYFLGESGAGVASVFALRNGSQALLTGPARFVDNFQYYIDATGGSTFVSTVNQFNAADYTLDATSTYGESLPREYNYTPVVYGATTAGTGTYTDQIGRYTRVGNLIHFTVRIVWTAHTGSGGMRIDLPISSVNTSGQRYSYPVYMADVTFTGSPVALILENSDHIRVRQNVSGGAVTDISLPSSGEVVITGTYEVL